MGFMFCDLHVSLNNPSSGDINSLNLPCCYLDPLSSPHQKKIKLLDPLLLNFLDPCMHAYQTTFNVAAIC